MSHTPASEHPHVMEGACTCPTGPVDLRLSSEAQARQRQEIVGWSLTCGLSSHRILARKKS